MSEISQTERVPDEELDQMIWKLERDVGMTPKLLSLMKELREVRKAKGEPVAYMIIDIDTGKKIIRPDESYFEGSCQPLYAAPPAPVVPVEMNSDKAWGELKISSDDCQAWSEGWNACRAEVESLNAEKHNQPVSETNKLE